MAAKTKSAKSKKQGSEQRSVSKPEEGATTAEQNGSEPTRSGPTVAPRVDIFETDDGLMLLADVPGTKADGFDISLDGRELTLWAKIEGSRPEGMEAVYSEYQPCDFERKFHLTGDFDADSIEAELTQGVLKLTIPKSPEAKAKRIQVKAEA